MHFLLDTVIFYMFPCTEETTQLEYSVEALKNLKGVVFAHLNIRNIINKLDSVRLLLTWDDIDVLVIGETFLNPSIEDVELQIPGYYFYRADRTEGWGKLLGGGLD